ncbi:MAG: MarR family winged helix-turn-helix transcriptional regulator [Sandarakinorhabdus sp.]|jgi:DNA-binding MarR family transcriptional regulator|nr:MarR family winged helix-turn-helix transcriptional regulator [Sandarakinorhabdus sp.]
MHNDPVWEQLFAEIAAIQQLTSAALRNLLPPLLSPAGFGVLDRLARQPGAWTPSRLAAQTQVTKGAMTNTLQRLETAGLVQLERDGKDGRARRVSLLPAGLAARDAALASIAPHMAMITNALPRHQARVVVPLLEQLRVWLDNHRPPPHSDAHD